MVPEPATVGVPEIARVVVLKAIPAGSEPTGAYVGAGVPSASGTVMGVMATFCVQVCASPVFVREGTGQYQRCRQVLGQ